MRMEGLSGERQKVGDIGKIEVYGYLVVKHLKMEKYHFIKLELLVKEPDAFIAREA
jgi:hypothetical protein